MALIKCHECGEDVSTDAKACPSCGAKVVKPKEPKKQTSPLVLAIVGAAGLGIVAVSVMSKLQEDVGDAAKEDEAKALHHDIGLAEVTCKMAFEKNAKSPESIEWIRPERKFLFTSEDKTKAISTQPVRAKNSFNATVRTIAVCNLEKKDGQWRLVSIKEQR